MKLHRDIGITQKSAWHLAHRLRKAWDHSKKSLTLFSGPVEVDESYFGGKRKNMSNTKRKELSGTGCGAVGKTTVVGIKDRKTNKVRAKVAQHTTRNVLQGFVYENSDQDSTIYTDDNPAYDGLANHETVKHSVNEYVKGQAHTNGVESFWSMLKRGYNGVYHHMSPEHLNRYVHEFSGRHNIRDANTIDQMAYVANGLLDKRLEYKELIGQPS